MGKPQKRRLAGQSGLEMKDFGPIGKRQEKSFAAFDNGQHLVLHGYAGTGKTFVACYLALKEMNENRFIEKVVIIRSAVPTRDLGFLPGTVDEKANAYEEPYIETINSIYGRGDAYGLLKKRGEIEFITTSFLRGINLNRAVVIVDEIQNMSYQELSTIITRIGPNSRIIFCGDFRQTDLIKSSEKQGLKDLLNILDLLPVFTHIEFQIDDIIRSDLVKDFIIASTQYFDKKEQEK